MRDTNFPEEFKIAILLTPKGIETIAVLNKDPAIRKECFKICSKLSEDFLEFEKHLPKEGKKILLKGVK